MGIYRENVGRHHYHAAFRKTALWGLDVAIDSVFHFNTQTLSGMWKTATENHYKQFMKDSVYTPVGNKIISEKMVVRQMYLLL